MSSRSSTLEKKTEQELEAKQVVVVSTKRLPGDEAVLTVRWTRIGFCRVERLTARLRAFGGAARSALATAEGTRAWVLTSSLSEENADADGVRLGRLHGFIPEKA